MVLTLIIMGLITGCLYSLVALGFNIIYGTTGTFHVSHGALYTLIMYFQWTVYKLFSSEGLGLFVALIAGLVIAIPLGYLINRFFYSFFRRRGTSRMIEFVASLGLAIIIESAIAIFWGPNPQSYNTSLTELQTYGAINWSSHYSLVVITTTLIFLIVYFILNKSSTGKKIRGLATNPELIRTLGLSESKLYSITFILGTLTLAPIALVAGMMSDFQPNAGSTLIFIAAIVVIMGGIGNLKGTFLAALILGLLQSVSTLYLTGTWQYTIAIIVFFIVIIIKPQGLLQSYKFARE